jgi:hypothetical protein
MHQLVAEAAATAKTTRLKAHREIEIERGERERILNEEDNLE